MELFSLSQREKNEGAARFRDVFGGGWVNVFLQYCGDSHGRTGVNKGFVSKNSKTVLLDVICVCIHTPVHLLNGKRKISGGGVGWLLI